MAERRRIIPSSVGPLFPVKKEKETVPSSRFHVTLKEPSDKAYSVFSYSQLVKNAAGEKNGNGVAKSFNDLDEEDADGLESIARKFEEKYAPKKGRKGRRACIDDLIDVGMGYDETDPFVDNSECYDELVPDVLTTQFGGFYINQGQLHFRERSDSENSGDFQNITRRKKTPKKRHRRITDGDKREGKRKRNMSSSSDKAAKKMRKQLQRQFGKPGRRKKNLSGRIPTVAELLKQREEAHKKGSTSGSKPNAESSAATNSNATKILPSSNQKPPSSAANGLPVDVTDLNASIGDIDHSLDLGLIMSDLKMDSDMAAAMEEALKGPMDDHLDMTPSRGDDKSMASSPEGPGDDGGMDMGEEVSLPNGLPPTLIYNVEKIKEAARKSVEGKCRFFTASVNSLLLKIENQSRELSCGLRSQLYSHLASNLPCTKETLLKRAKKLRLSAHDSNLKEPVQKLKEAIGLAMPAQLEQYQQECQVAAQYKYNAMMDKDSASNDDAKSKGPSKKFQWRGTMRDLLCTIVGVKLQTYKLSKIRTQSAEDYLKAFLDGDIKPLWPPGWMHTRTLFKESRSVHGAITTLNPKPRKMLAVAKKPPSTKTSPEELSDEPGFGHNQAVLGMTRDGHQEAFVRTILDYANDNSRPYSELATSKQQQSLLQVQPQQQQQPSKDQKELKPSNRPQISAVSATESASHRIHAPGDFVDLLIAKQLAIQDHADEERNSTTETPGKRDTEATTFTRTVPQTEAENNAAALQYDILRQAALLSQAQRKDTWRTEKSTSRQDVQPSYTNEIKAMAQASASSSSIHNSGRGTQAQSMQSKVTSKPGKTSFQLEFEKMYSLTKETTAATVPEVIQATPVASQKYQIATLQEVNLPSSAKASQSKSAFEKLRLAGQGRSGFDASIPVSQPVVKLTRHPNLTSHPNLTTARVRSDADSIMQATYKLASPLSSNLQQYTTASGKREPLTASHHLSPHANTPLVTSAPTSLPSKTQSSTLSSIYQPRTESSTFQTIAHTVDNPASSKHAGKSLTPTPPSYTSPSPPKGSPHSLRTSPYSTSPGQIPQTSSSPRHTSPHSHQPGFSQYQRTSTATSPGHSSSYSPNSYTPPIPSLTNYQQMALADLTRKQRSTSPGFASPTFPMTSGHVSPGHQGSPNQSTSPGDAIITGPAPGTFYHTQNTAAAAPTNAQRLLHQQQITLDSMLYAHQALPDPHRKQKQHRIP